MVKIQVTTIFGPIMTIKLVRVPETDYPEVGYKRVNAPYKLIGTCTCGEQLESDYTTIDYLSYPKVGQIRTLIAYCSECSTEHKMDVIFDIVLSPVTNA